MAVVDVSSRLPRRPHLGYAPEDGAAGFFPGPDGPRDEDFDPRARADALLARLGATGALRPVAGSPSPGARPRTWATSTTRSTTSAPGTRTTRGTTTLAARRTPSTVRSPAVRTASSRTWPSTPGTSWTAPSAGTTPTNP
ncbi:hypothetical protein ACFQV8_33085 [Pseudonocardia benzenivorans]